MKDIAQKYHSLGLSVVPVGSDKLPKLVDGSENLYAWKKHQDKLIAPNGNFDKAWGIAIVCGKASGVECIDIDCKYDLTGTLFDRYKKLIYERDKDLLKNLTVEETTSGGFHFLYRCSIIEKNQKLAKRPTTDSERVKTYETTLAKLLSEGKPQEESEKKAQKAKENDNVRGIIETRGVGGYFVCHPTKGYKLVYGSFENIHEITEAQRDILFECAILLNEYSEPKKEKKIYEKNYLHSSTNPFDDFNKRWDGVKFLEENGWELILTRGSHNFLKRPGGTHKWSADYDTDRKLLYIFSDSTGFDHEQAYNNISILKKIKFNDTITDKELAKWLFENGYGESTKIEKPRVQVHESKISVSDDSFDFLAKPEDADLYIEQKRNGTFKMGNKTGIPSLDKYWRFKDAQLDMILGHDNSGKSIVTWYFAMLDAHFNNKNYIVSAWENKIGGVKSKLMEYRMCKAIEKMTNEEFEFSKKWVEEHFAFIRNDESYNYMDMICMGEKMLTKKEYHKIIIDPYNSLDKKTTNEHQYDYDAMRDFRLFIRKTGMGVVLNVHAATDALRRTYRNGHKYEGYAMPPKKADAEGGGKFPNKADNFMIIHRMADHPEQWMWTEIHIDKVKEYETGGQRTFKDEPYKLRLIAGGYGFEDESGYNPMTGQTSQPYQPKPITQGNPNLFLEDKKVEEELEPPF